MRFVIFYLKCLDRKLIGSKDISSLTLWNEFREKQGKTYSRVFCSSISINTTKLKVKNISHADRTFDLSVY